MKKDKQLLVRVTKEEFDYITQLSNIEGKSISCIIRELINYRYNYLLKNNKVKKLEKSVENMSLNEIDVNTLNDFYKAFNVM